MVDAMFSTDLPTPEERRKILEIHIKKRKLLLDNCGLDEGVWTQLIKQTEEFVGSELEQIVINARFASFSARKSGIPTVEEWLAGVREVTPLSRIDTAGLQKIRDWCKGRAKPVNGLIGIPTDNADQQVQVVSRRRNVSSANN